jgi:imidazole glycerol-phosphate synthase subunit HisF
MLRKRVIAVLTFNDGILFRTKLFRPDYRYTVNFVDAWSIDEIVILDVTRDNNGDQESFLEAVGQFAAKCFVPISVGGGIRSLSDVKTFLGAGADKVVVNTGALEQPELIEEISLTYGAQCVVLSIDVYKHPDQSYEVYSHFGSRPTGMDPITWAQQGESLGVGELLLTPIEKDGWLQGYDLQLCRSVADAVNIPTLILGGAGNWQHLIDGIEIGHAAGVCTQNIYHFTESSIQSAKVALAKVGIPVRI